MSRRRCLMLRLRIAYHQQLGLQGGLETVIRTNWRSPTNHCLEYDASLPDTLLSRVLERLLDVFSLSDSFSYV